MWLEAMTRAIILCFVLQVLVCRCDWVSEWMSPVKDQIEDQPYRRSNNVPMLSDFEDEFQKTVPETRDFKQMDSPYLPYAERPINEQPTAGLKMKLENTLSNAKMLAEALKRQIAALSAKENALKEAITNGRSGVTTVTVETMNQTPRTYLIRDGEWSLCTGIIQTPVSQGPINLFNGMMSTPRCIGREIPTGQDPCVFNSVIKYETIPSKRRMQYSEDDYLCLKNTFNSTLERYMSVPKRLMNDTCHSGVIRSLEENFLECGVRILSEYNFYPNRGIDSLPTLPIEYCTENDGSCKLIVAWHVSNATIENFEFLKNENNFKKYFIKAELFNDNGMIM